MESNTLLLKDEHVDHRRDIDKKEVPAFGDENYCLKFGHLKKGCVLMFYQRYNDALEELNKAA